MRQAVHQASSAVHLLDSGTQRRPKRCTLPGGIRAPYGLDLWQGLPEAEEPRFLSTRPMPPTPEQQAEIDAPPVQPVHLGGMAFNEHAPKGVKLEDFANSRLVRAKAGCIRGGINGQASAALGEQPGDQARAAVAGCRHGSDPKGQCRVGARRPSAPSGGGPPSTRRFAGFRPCRPELGQRCGVLRPNVCGPTPLL